MPQHDNSIAGNTGGSAVTVDQTISFTVASNSNRYLGVWIHIVANSYAVSGVTYNGVALTKRREQVHTSESFLRLQYWDLVNPATGTHDLVITPSASTRLAWEITSLYDVDQTTPRGTMNDAEGNSSAPSVTISSASGELVCDGTACADTRTIAEDASQTLNAKIETNDLMASSREAGAGSVVMSWAITGGTTFWLSMGVPIKPVGTTVRTVGTIIPWTKTHPNQVEQGVEGTLILVNSTTSAGGAYDTASVTPIANYLHLAFVLNSKASAPDNSFITGQNFATWVRVTNRFIGSTHILNVFRARGTAPAAGTLRITFGGGTETGCFWHESWWADTWGESDPSDFGSSAIVDFANTVGTAVTSATVTLSAFGTKSSWDAIVAGFGIMVNTNINAETGYTRIGTSGFNTPATAGMVCWKSLGGDITPSASWTGSSPAAGGIALQLKSNRQIHQRASGRLVAGIKAAVGQALASTGTFVRTIASQLSKSDSVKRIAWYLRSVSAIRPQSSAISRIRRLLKTIPVIRDATSSVTRLKRFVRTIPVVRSASSAITRLIWHLGRVSTAVSRAISVRRIQYFLRPISLIVRQTSLVTRAKNFVRNLSTIRAASSLVTRLARRLRTVASIIALVSLVRRIGSLRRSIASVLAPNSLVRRLIWIKRTISHTQVIKGVISVARAFRRTISLIRAQTSSVKRVVSYVRRVTATVSGKAIVNRFGYFARRITTTGSILARVVRALSGGITVRTVATIRLATSQVGRLARYLRSVRATVPQTSSIQRLSRYLRRVSTAYLTKATVTRSKIFVRAISTVRSLTTSVKRIARYLRTLSVLRPVGVVVSRIARYLRRIGTSLSILARVVRAIAGGLTVRTVTTVRSVSDGVSRIAWKMRTLVAKPARAISVKRISYLVRNIALVRYGSYTIKRIASYLRTIVSRLATRPSVQAARNLGERVMLRVETFLREKITHRTQTGQKINSGSMTNEKDRYRT